ncbi:MAG: enoyl-CoA hydratase-related protein, partial [Acidobacteriota bacterium]|nr:enoyl-CoA hydratase-related protein [Acidobacteriota bacterium]
DLLFSTLIGGYPVPIVACAKGLIGGWALDVVLGAHLCFAAESCRFDLSGSPGRLAGNAPKGFEPDKNVLSAWEMLELGEINGLDRQSKMMEQAKMAALRISEMAPLAVKACLKAVRESEKSTLTDGLAMEAALFAELFESQDMRRGTAAFLEKTVPVFEGN